jgi:hypothetical protein
MHTLYRLLLTSGTCIAWLTSLEEFTGAKHGLQFRLVSVRKPHYAAARGGADA